MTTIDGSFLPPTVKILPVWVVRFLVQQARGRRSTHTWTGFALPLLIRWLGGSRNNLSPRALPPIMVAQLAHDDRQPAHSPRHHLSGRRSFVMHRVLGVLLLWINCATLGFQLPPSATALLRPASIVSSNDVFVSSWTCSSTRTRCVLAASKQTPSWHELEEMLGETFTQPAPVVIDSVLDPSIPPMLSAETNPNPILFRERHGWCPYSERVWLAMELLHIPYDTILIDNTGHGPRPSYFAGQTPQVQWPMTTNPNSSERRQGESMDILAQLELQYHCDPLQTSNPGVQDVIRQFSDIFPRARPSSRAAYLFQTNGEPLWKSTFQATLQKIDDLLSQHNDGPYFLGGNHWTAADLAYVPFLERYRYQLPCLHNPAQLNPNDPLQYPHLAAWYNAMDSIPEYACRIKGDASSWAKVLQMAGYGNAGMVPDDIQTNSQQMLEMPSSMTQIDLHLWNQYATSRPYVASTPQGEAALVILRNRVAIVKDAVKRLVNTTIETVDSQLRGLAHVLLRMHSSTSPTNSDVLLQDAVTEKVRSMAKFLDQRMCVPRDMGAMPAACIKEIATSTLTQ